MELGSELGLGLSVKGQGSVGVRVSAISLYLPLVHRVRGFASKLIVTGGAGGFGAGDRMSVCGPFKLSKGRLTSSWRSPFLSLFLV